MNLEQRLTELSIILPPPLDAGGQYSPAVVFNGLVWASGQLPREGDNVIVAGKLGRGVALEQAQLGARIALIRTLAAVRDAVGDIKRVSQILKLNVYVNCTEEFTQHSAVADGASKLIFELFGSELGKHARTSVGVAQLPRNACVELDIVVAYS